MSDFRPYSDTFDACRQIAERMLGARQIYVFDASGGASASITKEHDGRFRISMPTMMPGALISRHEADRIIGFILHECAHARFTDWGLKYPKELHPLVNALEDIRIENATIKSGHPENAKELFALTSDQMALQAMMEHPDLWDQIPKGHPAGIQNFIITQGRIDLGYEANTTAAVANRAPQEVKDLYAKFRKEILSTTSTSDVVALAQRIAKAQQEQAQQQQQGDDGEEGSDDQKQGQGKGQGKGKGAPSQGQSQGQQPSKPSDDENEDEGDGEDDGDGEGDGEGEGEDDAPAQGQQKGSGSGKKAAPPEINANVEDIAKKRAEETGLKINNQHVKVAVSNLHQNVKKVMLRAIHRSRSAPHDVDRAMRAVTNAARLKDQIRRMLKSQDEMSRTRFESAGRLDRRSIARLDTGATNVFGRRDFKEGVRTAVAILVDCSPSMDGARTAAAQAMALHLALACEAAGAETAALIFTEGNSGRDAAVAYLKNWNERVGSVKDAFVTYPQSSGTMLSPGIQMTAKILASRRNVNKRILLTLTDGECNFGTTITRAVCTDAMRAGIDVVGIGCQCDVKAAFPNYANVYQLNELATTAMAQIIKIMEHRR